MKTYHKLISYSSSAIAFILLHDAKAQAVYTDIDPDYVFDQSPEGVWLDIDDNGTFDIGFQNYSFTTYSFSIQETHTFQFLLAIRYDVENAFAGDFNIDCFPYALDNENLINSTLSWQNCQTQFLAFKRLHSGLFTHTGYYENWYNPIISETIDHYMGIRFIDENACNHYGWIRCDVLDEGRTLIIKDYAYETKCDVGILAGDKVGDTSVQVENRNPLDANVYVFENILYAELKDLNEKTELKIYSISGDLIYTKALTELNSEIYLSVPKGIYLVKVISKNNSFAKEVLIN